MRVAPWSERWRLCPEHQSNVCMVTKPQSPDVDAAINIAEQVCREHRLRLTEKRKRVLITLLKAPNSLSAYDLAHHYRDEFGEEIPVMSVYRMLDVFVTAGLVHKLRSTNHFLPCSHVACEHEHATAQFLICDQCGLVSEMDFADQELAQLAAKAASAGFHINREQLELHGLCEHCQASA
jgi:Fur family zinc uptake transcriptional regulator